MAFTNPLPRLLGMDNSQPDPYQTLLGGYYTPPQARMAWVGGTLQGLGAGLASGRPGAWAQGVALGGTQGLDDYRQRAVVANQIAHTNQDQQWQQQEHDRQQGQWSAQDAWQANPDDKNLFAKAYPGVYASQYAQSLFPDQQGDDGGLGMTPVYMTNGKDWTIGQLSPNGGIYIGSRPAGPEWHVDPGGYKYAQTFGAKEGAGAGDAAVNYDSLISKLPGLEEVVTQLKDLSKTATYTLGGQAGNWIRTQAGFGPSDGQVARTKYEAIVANQILPMLRDTFGAQFTAAEGDNLRATLGDPNKTPEEKQAVLEAWIEQHKRNITASGVQSGKLPPPGSGATEDPLGLR